LVSTLKKISNEKERILNFLKLPPPITGATLMNKRVHDSKVLRKTFNIRSICISYNENLKEMGRWKILKLLKVMLILKRLLCELYTYRPAFVYFQISPHKFAFFRDLFFVTVIKLFHVKILFHMHGKGIKDKSPFAKLFFKYSFKRESLICLSSSLVNDIEDVFKSKAFIVPNGIPDDNPDNIKKILGGTSTILFLSNLRKSKGLVDYINALTILNIKDLDFEGIIVGEEADISKNQLYQMLKHRGIDKKVRYLGARYDREKDEVLLNSDVFVFPTRNDIWGNVILEAMQYGKPVIATNEGAIADMIDDGVTGFLVDKDVPEQIAEKVEILIRDPALRKKMGEAGRRKYEEKYTLQHFEENMKKVFQEVLYDIYSKPKKQTRCT